MTDERTITDRPPADKPASRWGADDERGALNLLTPDKVMQALTSASEGIVIPLGTEVGKRGLVSGGRNATWHVTMTVQHPSDPGRGRAEDMLVMHTHAHSHMDGLAHVWYDGKLYNGFDAASVGRGGTKRLSVSKIGGIVTRGVLLDVGHGDRRWSAGELITADDLEAAAGRAALDIEAGDGVMIRTGWLDEALGGGPKSKGDPGLAADAVDWLADHDPSLIGMDTASIEPVPAPPGVNPLLAHEVFLRDRGVYLLELLDLRGLVEHQATTFTLVVAPLLVSRGLGSPINPIAIV